jgi:hypothetical protein
MGEIVKVTCSECDIDRDDFLGWGMAGHSRTLCACDHCHRLIVKQGSWQQEEPAVLRCPYCKRPVRRVFPAEDLELNGVTALGRCPRCDGTLYGDVHGCWD